MLDAIKSANIANNILILKDLFYLEGVVAHGRASSSLAFGTSSQQGPQSFSIAGLFLFPQTGSGARLPRRKALQVPSGNGRGGDETSVPGGDSLASRSDSGGKNALFDLWRRGTGAGSGVPAGRSRTRCRSCAQAALH